MMLSPFVIIRFVFFALLVNLNLLLLAFASWNVSANVATGISASATPIFIILISCAIFFCVTLGLVELLVPRARTSHLLFECIWSTVLSIFQTGTAISVTAHSPAICQATSDWDICASTSLLVPTAWLSSIILFTYFLAMFITGMAHIRLHPNIWMASIYSVEWFKSPASYPTEKDGRTSDSNDDSWSRYMGDVEASRNQCGHKAPWARNIRRGIDAPFERRDRSSSSPTSPSTTATPLPIAPLKVQPRSIAGSRFIEKFRESQIVSRSETPSQYGMHFSSRVDPFPPRVEDHDLPIPLPRLSEWIRADAIKGINVHTIPHSP